MINFTCKPFLKMESAIKKPNNYMVEINSYIGHNCEHNYHQSGT